MKGISENISRTLQTFNIRVAHKPITKLRQLLTNVKEKDEPRNVQGAVYKINCLIVPTATPTTSARLAETSQLD